MLHVQAISSDDRSQHPSLKFLNKVSIGITSKGYQVLYQDFKSSRFYCCTAAFDMNLSNDKYGVVLMYLAMLSLDYVVIGIYLANIYIWI